MDFGRDSLVFVKGEEKTDNLADIGVIGASINVKYKHKDLIYSYDTNSAVVLSDPKIIDLSGGAVLYHNNIPLSGVKEAYRFTGFYSVYFDEAPRRTYQEVSISVEPNVLNEIREKADTPLYMNLEYVRPDTVLHQYMKEVHTKQETLEDKSVFYPYDYNLSQKKAIKKALSNTVSVVDSGVGTGRTKTILNLILNLVIRNQTVAVVAKDNARLENIYEKMEKEGYGFLFARPGIDILGGSDNSGLCGFEKSAAVNEQEIISLNQKLGMLLELEKKGKKIQEQLSLYQLEQKHFMNDKPDRKIKKFPKLPWKKWDPDIILKLWADIRLMLNEGKDDAFWPTPRCFFEYGLHDIGDVMMTENESIYTLQYAYYTARIKELEKELKKIRMTLKSQQYEKLIESQKELSSKYIKNNLIDRFQDQTFEFNALAYKEVYDEFACFLNRYPVIMCTIDSFKDSIRRNYVYDCLIIDEASVIDTHTGLEAMSCSKKAIFIGDSKQPGPNLMASVIGAFGDSAPATVLREQYLCHPSVIRYFNEKFYEDDLIAYGDPEIPETDSMYYRRQADALAKTLKVSLDKEDDLTRFIEYVCVDEYLPDGDVASVYSLLYKDYNSIILPLQNKFLRRSKYKTKTRLFAMIDEILKDHKYRHLSFRYDVRLGDLIKNDDAGNHVVDFVLYDMFGSKPELIIEAGDSDKLKESLIEENGISVLRLRADDVDPEKRIIQDIEKAFFNIV
jgi:hypothetical protein